jgi:hypothetical protein
MTMDLPRIMAVGLAANRMAFGLNYVLRPESAGPSWIGRVAKRPGTKVMTRSQGIRDLALGAGALAALARHDAADARIWVASHALADATDATDFAVTWLSRDRLPDHGSKLALIVAGVSTAIGAAAATGIRR